MIFMFYTLQIDVGGQRTERRKWIHLFDDVLVLIFLTAVSEYDQVLMEDGRTNRVRESLSLFKTILNYHWFKHTSVVLFLNKKDLLEEKINSGKSPLSHHFEEFRGDDNNFDHVTTFFKNAFSDLNPNPHSRDVFVHLTCAIDTENIRIVNTAVQSVIMQKILNTIGIS